MAPEIIKVGVVTIDMSSIGIKFENFMQAGCRDQGSHFGLTKYKQSFISEKTVLYLTIVSHTCKVGIICHC